ncbi:unnamed protein product [Polarella glacialis]|uniref:Uncharacterized protein n=1 Tax=Polarella glacialis TaxID=89957 RepID=A0A813JWR4_POLGL|nr:unnamed protein product [Polarella glacialis]
MVSRKLRASTAHIARLGSSRSTGAVLIPAIQGLSGFRPFYSALLALKLLLEGWQTKKQQGRRFGADLPMPRLLGGYFCCTAAECVAISRIMAHEVERLRT